MVMLWGPLRGTADMGYKMRWRDPNFKENLLKGELNQSFARHLWLKEEFCQIHGGKKSHGPYQKLWIEPFCGEI